MYIDVPYKYNNKKTKQSNNIIDAINYTFDTGLALGEISRAHEKMIIITIIPF